MGEEVVWIVGALGGVAGWIAEILVGWIVEKQFGEVVEKLVVEMIGGTSEETSAEGTLVDALR